MLAKPQDINIRAICARMCPRGQGHRSRPVGSVDYRVDYQHTCPADQVVLGPSNQSRRRLSIFGQVLVASKTISCGPRGLVTFEVQRQCRRCCLTVFQCLYTFGTLASSSFVHYLENRACEIKRNACRAHSYTHVLIKNTSKRLAYITDKAYTHKSNSGSNPSHGG